MHLLANKVNPFKLIAEIPFVKKRHKKMGIVDFQKEIDNVFSNKNFGLSMTFAGGILLSILFVLILSIFGFIRKLFQIEWLLVHFIIFGVLSAIICYFFVFKNDKYIKYFDIFEKWDKKKKSKYRSLTFASTIIVFLLFILSF
jgi:DNA integrity scanning protein DisA with diadenylate cyclase activity